MNCYGSTRAALSSFDRAILTVVQHERLYAAAGLTAATITSRLSLFIGPEAAGAIRLRLGSVVRPGDLEALGLVRPRHSATRLRWRKA